jgi:hypothetical protein
MTYNLDFGAFARDRDLIVVTSDLEMSAFALIALLYIGGHYLLFGWVGAGVVYEKNRADATVANIKRNKGDLGFIEFLLSSMEIHALTALSFS